MAVYNSPSVSSTVPIPPSAFPLLIVQRFVADILPAPRAAETDVLDCRVCLKLRLGNGRAQRSDTQHATAARHDLTVTHFRPGMKDFDVRNLRRFIESADWLARLILARIAFACHHDAHGRARIPHGRRDFLQPSVDGCLE